MKIAIFGGAFDPPHLGHINLVNSARKHIEPDKTLIIPTGNAPHKTSLTPFETRFKLAQAAFPHCEISTLENTESINYTVDTLSKIKELYPDSELFLIIGSDSLENFTEWKDYEQILKLCTVVAAARDYGNYKETAERFGIQLINAPVIEMSSEEIRNCFKPKRYTHSINVAIMCGELSKAHRLSHEIAEKAYIAGIFHDITKKNKYAFTLTEAELTEFNVSAEEVAEPKLWHAITGAKYVRDVLKIHDREIINAIRYHTIARANMSIIEKIVYIADKISAERDYKGVEELRQTAFDNLDLAVYTAIKRGIKKTLKKDASIPEYCLNAYHQYNKNFVKREEEREKK